MIRPQDITPAFTHEDEEILKSLELKVDEQIRSDMEASGYSEIDMYEPFTREDGKLIPDRIWERLMQKYARAGWDVTRRGRIYIIRK